MEFIKFLEEYKKTIPEEKLKKIRNAMAEAKLHSSVHRTSHECAQMSLASQVDVCVSRILQVSRCVKDRQMYMKHLATTFKWENVALDMEDDALVGLLRLWLQQKLDSIPVQRDKRSFLDQATVYACTYVFQ